MRNEIQTLARHPTRGSAITWKAAVLGVVAALASCTAIAQTKPAPVPPAHIIISDLPMLGCPVAMTALQRSASALREVPGAFSGAGRRPRQGVTLTLKGSGPLAIASAEIIVHGLPATPRAVAVDGGAAPDVSRSYHLVNVTTGGLTSDVWMAGVSALRWIELKSITYSDGSEWHESSSVKCGVAPDPYVLVSAR